MIDQPNEVEALCPMIVGSAGTRIAGGSVHAASIDDFYAFRQGILEILLEDGNDAVLPARVFAVGFGDLGHSIAVTRYVVVNSLLHHHGNLRIIEALPMLDSVHAGDHRVPEALATVGVGRYFFLMAVRLIHDR